MRIRVLLAAALTATAVGAVPANAAGTGGIEVSPYPGVVDGHQVTAFHASVPRRGDGTVAWSLRNTTGTTKSGRLYAASATSDGHGGWAIGDAGSSPYLEFADRQVTLAPHETRVAEFRVHGKVEGTQHAALVVEVRNGSVVARAATLIYLTPGPVVPLPTAVVGLAGLVLLAAGSAFLRARRQLCARQQPATPVG